MARPCRAASGTNRRRYQGATLEQSIHRHRSVVLAAAHPGGMVPEMCPQRDVLRTLFYRRYEDLPHHRLNGCDRQRLICSVCVWRSCHSGAIAELRCCRRGGPPACCRWARRICELNTRWRSRPSITQLAGRNSVVGLNGRLSAGSTSNEPSSCLAIGLPTTRSPNAPSLESAKRVRMPRQFAYLETDRVFRSWPATACDVV